MENFRNKLDELLEGKLNKKHSTLLNSMHIIKDIEDLAKDNIESFIKAVNSKKDEVSPKQNNPVIKQSDALDFADWLMTNCELADDNSLWSYEGDDYDNERLYKIFLEEKK